MRKKAEGLDVNENVCQNQADIHLITFLSDTRLHDFLLKGFNDFYNFFI